MNIWGRGTRCGAIAVLAALGWFAMSGPGGATEAGRFDAFIQSDAHSERAAGSALAADAAMPPECGQRQIERRIDTEILLMPRFAGPTAAPSEGSWMERWAVTRCGEARQVNLHFTVARGGEITVDVAIPGETAADPAQQLGVMQALSPYARDALGGCADFAVVDSSLYGRTAGSIPAQGSEDPVAWAERWTVAGCGASRTFLIRFEPDEARSLVGITLL